MPVFKIEKNDNYTVMSNYHLRDKNLSYKAKGLLSFMLSLPNNWDYSLAGLCSISKEGGVSWIIQRFKRENNNYIPPKNLFLSKYGEIMFPDTVLSKWMDFRKRHPEIRNVSLHGLRHSANE